MHLKTYLRHNINNQMRDLETEKKQLKSILENLEKTSTSKSMYIVELQTRWMLTGEKDTETTHKGTLEQAIKKAEKEFMKTNNRDNVMAEYSVFIQINKNYKCEIPEHFWEKYAKKSFWRKSK